ncbi:MAG: UDP-N-acetylmuramoyl-L-alanine--D-glutamate ligase [Firmicutes bacterium]|jgi:UDP-N-acetylmuramoylalanine--D-glutamate ligase|nr:UDP-N-acetylmuramoyl-L-alanine--D-glutamate ligase [Bacillota bacterium]
MVGHGFRIVIEQRWPEMLLEKIRKKETVVVGLGLSGLATVCFLLELGASKVVVNDRRRLCELEQEMTRLKNDPRISVVSGEHPTSLINEKTGLVVKSPGVNPHLGILEKAHDAKIPIISEIELAYHFTRVPIIGITGTNGKTTTTMMVSEIFQRARFGRTFTAGNIGSPLVDAAREAGATPGDMIVAELSSFQLDNTINFRPLIAVILNIGEDHLDYHLTREKYADAKKKILANQTESDVAVLNADDPLVLSFKNKTRASPLFFSRKKMVEGFCVRKGTIGLNREGVFEPLCSREKVALPGNHNLENALAAASAAWAGGVDLKTIGDVLESFEGLEHRLEHVRVMDGITFVNDSKGTNPEASIGALEAFPGKEKILIAGGKEEGLNYEGLVRAAITNRVKMIVLLGETAHKIKEAAHEAGFEDTQIVASLEEAVAGAWKNAVAGDIILLSPASASMDMFANYEERGRRFKEVVNALRG